MGTDPAVRRVVRLGLELDGAIVVEGDSVDEARDRALSGRYEVRGVVVDAGVGAEEARLLWPSARLVVLDEDAGSLDPDTLGRRLDLRLPPRPTAVLDVAHVLREEVAQLAEAWRELCRWDPMLPPD
ncbi:MAG TPA: hypothetical protein VGO92_06155, partial [Acidimicrobiales bacterium]|nr:hypothetical protein [Acidimicrobiales bacterium]